MPHAVEQEDYKTSFAKFILQEQLLRDAAPYKPSDFDKRLISQTPTQTNYELLGRAEDVEPIPAEKLKVCIVGAGVAGLYTAHILDVLGIDYDVLEASDRPGGRLFTHYFSTAKHDYYDIGAMRFPDSPIMARTFNLFKDKRIALPLIPYYMKRQDLESEPRQPSRFNDRTVILPDAKEVVVNSDGNEIVGGKKGSKELDDDPFMVSRRNGGPVPNETVATAQAIMEDAYAVYKHKIKQNPHTGFRYLMRHDKFSLRDYLHFVEDQDYESIHWLETINSATGWFDMAFSENVLEELAFDYSKDTKWWCIDGGTDLLTQRMVNKLLLDKTKITYGARVDSIALQRKWTQQGEKGAEDKMAVQVNGEKEARRYATVINTTTLAALQKMDLTDLELPYATKTAIRSLRYDTSTKVGIKFKKPWWINDPYKIKGGLGKTDMPLRVCVYPSYNIDDGGDNPAVLLCSYTWGQDSERIASMVNLQSPKDESALKDLMLENLARLHTCAGQKYEDVLKMLKENYLEHHAYDWSKDPYTCGGAFALFGPGQFRNLYPYLVRPAADSRFHIVGEAASAHHAWIVGALNSAVRGVYMFLERFGLRDLQKKLEDEFGRCSEVDYDGAHMQVAIGMLPPAEQPAATYERLSS